MVGKLTRPYWLMVFICCFCFSTFASLINILVGLISSTVFKDLLDRQVAMERSAKLTSIPFAIATFFGFFVGLVTDVYGHRTSFLFFACVIGLTGICLFYINNLMVAMVSMGVSYTLFTNIIWSSLPLIVSKTQFVKFF